MKKTNRGLLYKYCIEYIKILTIRQELFFLDPEIECMKTKKRLEKELEVLENGMLNTLKEE